MRVLASVPRMWGARMLRKLILSNIWPTKKNAVLFRGAAGLPNARRNTTHMKMQHRFLVSASSKVHDMTMIKGWYFQLARDGCKQRVEPGGPAEDASYCTLDFSQLCIAHLH